MVTLEVKQPAEKRMYAEAETNPQVDIIWHTVPFSTKIRMRWTFWARFFRPAPAGFTKAWCWASRVATRCGRRSGFTEVGGLFRRQRRSRRRP